MQNVRHICATNAGMWGVWDLDRFKDIHNYESWEKEFGAETSIVKNIIGCSFVPININSDGCYDFQLRYDVDHAGLSERESKCLLVTSFKFILKTHGIICFGGIEYVESKLNKNIGNINVPEGTYEILIHLIEWNKEKDNIDADGKPTPSALPDFIVTMSPSVSTVQISKTINTFPKL